MAMKLRIYGLIPLLAIGLLGASVGHPVQAEGRFSLRALVGAPAPAQVLITPDGKRVITAGQDDLVRVWDIAQLRVLSSFGHKGAAVERIALFEGLLFAGDADGVTRAYTVHDGKEQYSMLGNGRPVIAVDAAPGLVGVGALHGPLQIFDADTGRPLGRADGPGEWFARAVFDLPRKRAASTGAEGHVRVWNLDTGGLIHTLKVGGVQTTQLVFSPDGRLLAGGDWDGHVRVWDTDSGELLHTLAGTGHTGGVAFSSDSEKIYLRGPENAPVEYLLSDASRREFRAVPRWTGLPPEPPAAQSDAVLHARADAATRGNTLVAAWGDTLRVWDLSAAEQLAWTDTGLTPIVEVDVSPGGDWVSSANAQGLVQVYASHNGALYAQMVLPEGPARAVAWDPSGRHLAIAGPDRLVRVWSPLEASPARVIFGHERDVVDLAWQRDGSLLATDQGGTAIRWSLQDQQALSKSPMGCAVQGMDLSPQGQSLVWCTNGKAFTRPSLAANDVPKPVDFSGAIQGAWSPGTKRYLLSDGAGLSLLSADGNLLFNAQSAVRPTALEWEGDLVAVGSAGGSVTLLNADLEQIQTLRGQSGVVSTISLSPKAKVLAAGSTDGTLRIWHK